MSIPLPPELSIVVPVLDEATTLPALFRSLAGQQQLLFEVIFCDGGSGDGSGSIVEEWAQRSPFPCHFVTSGRGRGRQMNAGAAVARGAFLLFLHADSLFDDPLALHAALAALRSRCGETGSFRTAGRFALNFFRGDFSPSPSYYFFECKARLGRAGCIHGDQGFLLHRSFFAEIGPFPAELPVFEDDRLAEKVFATGEWILLPAAIFTSARRFEREGLCRRQTLNALLMNFAAIGWNDFFRHAEGIYRQQSRAAGLDLYPFFRLIDDLVGRLPWRGRLALWYATGTYVRNNAWQLAFACDVRRNYRHRLSAGEEGAPILRLYDRWIDPMIDHPPGRLLAALLTWCWFHATRCWLRQRHKNTHPDKE